MKKIGHGQKPCHKPGRTSPAIMRRLQLSPSEFHRKLLGKTKLALGYGGGDVAKWQKRLRRKLLALLGDQPKERASLETRTIWRQPHPLGTIEKIVFRSEPCADVPAYVCLPARAQPPYTFFICLQGHTSGMHLSIGLDRGDEKRTIKVAGDRDFAISCMKRGIAALCLEQRAFGERRERAMEGASPLGCLDAALQALMLGRTLIGERLYDIDRALDYLAERGDADMARIGVMGNSAGGAMSMYAAALLPRIAFAMPSCYFCTFRDSVMAMNHCEENYIPGLLKIAEMSDIMGLAAPKALVLVAGREDSLFPIAATRSAFRDLRKIYAAAGAVDRCHLVVGSGGHRFYADAAWRMMMKEIHRLRS
jgi:dienelactone hydrolase